MENAESTTIFDWDDEIEYFEAHPEELDLDPAEEPSYELVFDIVQDMYYVELDELKSFCDSRPTSQNTLVARGESKRWDGIYTGYSPASDFDSLLSSTFKDCDHVSLADENGDLQMSGSHHDGYVSVDVRQLTDLGEEVYQSIVGGCEVPDEAWGGGYWDDDIDTMNKLWNDPTLCPKLHYGDFLHQRGEFAPSVASEASRAVSIEGGPSEPKPQTR